MIDSFVIFLQIGEHEHTPTVLDVFFSRAGHIMINSGAFNRLLQTIRTTWYVCA